MTKTATWRKLGMGLSLLLLGTVSCDNTNSGLADPEETERFGAEEQVNAADFNNTFAARHYEGWDANKDRLLDEDEYYASLHDTWDANNDGWLDESEWGTASNDFDLDDIDYSEWDNNSDGTLDGNEFGAGFASANWHGAWDSDHDNMVSEREYTDGVFRQWDADGDGMLDESERSVYSTYYGD